MQVLPNSNPTRGTRVNNRTYVHAIGLLDILPEFQRKDKFIEIHEHRLTSSHRNMIDLLFKLGA